MENERKIQNLTEMVSQLYFAVRRIEALMGISDPPEEWGITNERLAQIAQKEGISMACAREMLIRRFGVWEEEKQ